MTVGGEILYSSLYHKQCSMDSILRMLSPIIFPESYPAVFSNYLIVVFTHIVLISRNIPETLFIRTYVYDAILNTVSL